MGFRYGEKFEVLDIGTQPADADTLDTLLAPMLLAQMRIWEPPAKRLRSLLTPLCQSVVIEKDYIDLDYRAGFARFYYLRHHDTPRRCRRLHFFSCQLTREHMKDMPLEIREQYLGFTVLRPFLSGHLGRSVLSDRFLPVIQGIGETFITCKTGCRVNLAGNEIEFYGVPWMEQDRLISACASAALWMASCYMSLKYHPEFKEYCTPEITDMATRYSVATGRPMPSTGLRVEQMMYALQEMGYEPVPYEPDSARGAHRTCYRYVESEIPVIIALNFLRGGHVVTAVGHTFSPKRKPKIEQYKFGKKGSISYCRTSDFTEALIIQDDAGGPFRHLEFVEWDAAVRRGLFRRRGWFSKKQVKELRRKYNCVAVLDRGTETEDVGLLNAVIAPLPPGVILGGYGAEVRAIYLVLQYLASRGISLSDPLVFRTFLQRSNTLKEAFKPRPNLSRVLSREIRRHTMSKWVWVTEVADINELISRELAMGQVIQDCASHTATLELFDLIAFHLPGILVTVEPDETVKTYRTSVRMRFPRFTRG